MKITGFIVGFLFAFLGCADYSKIITDGEYDGFVIGSSPSDVYLRIQEKFKNKEFSKFFVSPTLNSQSLSEVNSSYQLYNAWSISLNMPAYLNEDYYTATIFFEKDSVNRIVLLGKKIDDSLARFWNPGTIKNNDTLVMIGMETKNTYEKILKIENDEELKDLSIHMENKNFEKPFDPFMAKHKNYFLSPVEFDWFLKVESANANDDLVLSFRNEKLFSIERRKRKSE